MTLALTLLAIAALTLGALYLNARRYIAHTEQAFPPLGRFVDADGVAVHVVERGPEQGLRVLLLHGASANARELLQPLTPLAADHRLIAIDRPGYGYSSRPRDAHRIGLQAKLVARVLDQTGGAAIIVAHSLGVSVALRLAIERPELVRGLVLVSPASHPWPWRNAWWVDLAATPFFGPLFVWTLVPLVAPLMAPAGIANVFAPAPVPEAYAQDGGVALAFRPRAFRASACDVNAANQEFAAQAPRYPEITAPAVIVTTDKDRVVSPKIHARALSHELSGAEMVVAAGAGHMPHRVRTDLVINAVKRVEALASAPAQS
jgi:pimeloyl-ACP methyl ester carboxylesterase